MTVDRPPDFKHAAWRAAQSTAKGRRVQIAQVDGWIGMRDSTDPDGPVLVFTPQEWRDFVAGVNRGEFDVEELTQLAKRRPNDK